MSGLEIPLWIILPFLFVIGSVLGSFLNVCIYRMPLHETLGGQLRALWTPAWSFCPNCRNRIPGSDNIPVLGWLKLGGRCRFCRMRIAARYPLIEFLNGLLFVVVYWLEIPSDIPRSLGDGYRLFAVNGPQILDLWSTAAWLHWRYVYHMVLIQTLLVATFIDLDTMTIPDGATVPAMIVGLAGGFALGQVFLVPVWFQSPPELHIWKASLPTWLQPLMSGGKIPEWITAHPHWHGLAVSAAGLIVGGGVVWIVRIIGQWVLKREAMGFGDVTLMAAIGSFVGWQPALVIFFVAPFCAIFVAVAAVFLRKAGEIPYGPYLSLSTLVVLTFWRKIWPPAERMFQMGILIVIFVIVIPVLLAGCLQMLQRVKRVLGIPLYTEPDEWIEEWRPADQLHHLAGENVDDRQGRWPADNWPGVDAGRGMSQERGWREG